MAPALTPRPDEQAHIPHVSAIRNRCPHPECGRVFKDLAAHMLTHMEERPEKCPIETCEYHTKGFARKYDKNRHALTHYKGTMVCPFCPNAGTAYEKAFNRADVFKRHLTAVHNVEQTPPNSRKLILTTGGGRSGGLGAKCSICQSQFATAQEFYEHLDDCVLNVIVPSSYPKTVGSGSGSSSARKDSGARTTPTTASTDKGKDLELESEQEKEGRLQSYQQDVDMEQGNHIHTDMEYSNGEPRDHGEKVEPVPRDTKNRDTQHNDTHNQPQQESTSSSEPELEIQVATGPRLEPMDVEGSSASKESTSRSEGKHRDFPPSRNPEVTLGSPMPPDGMDMD